MLMIRVLLLLCLASQAFAASHGTPWLNESSPLGSNTNQVTANSPERPFLNLFKEVGGWITARFGNVDTGDEVALYANCVDANHYLNVSPATCNGSFGTNFTALVAFMNNIGSYTPPYPAGNYVLLWDGNSNAVFQSNFTGNSDVATVTSCPIASYPNRMIFTFASPGTPGNRQEVDETSIGTGGSYPTNIRFVYSPDSTCGAAGVREALLATAPSCTAIGQNTSGIFDPVFLGLMAPFNPVRFMKWSEIDAGNPLANWSDRSLPCWVFWNEGVNGVRLPTTSNNIDMGVPFEIEIALCNVLNADCWLNLPFLLTPSAMTSLATLEHANLKSNLKTYVESGDEYWNPTGAEVGTGVYAAAGALGDAAYPCTAQVPTDPCPTPNPGSANQKWFAFAALQNFRISAAWSAAWGSDYGRAYPVVGGQNGFFGGFTQGWLDFLDTWYGGLVCSGCSGNAWSGRLATQMKVVATAPYFPPLIACPRSWTADADGGQGRCFQQITKGGLLEPSIGANTTTHTTDSLSACSVATGVAANHYSVSSGHSYGSLVNGMPVQLKFDVASTGICDDVKVDGLSAGLIQRDEDVIIVDNTGAGFPAGISGTVLTVTNANVNLTTCCTVAKIGIGGTVNGSGVSAGTFITGDATSGATACAGSPCTGVGYSGTYRVNNSQTVTCNKCTVASYDCSNPLNGAACDTTGTWIFVFTNATSASAMAPSWRVECSGANCADTPTSSGWIAQELGFLASDITSITSAPYNLLYACYEGGQAINGLSNGDEIATLAATMARSPTFYQVYQQYFGSLRAAGLNGPCVHFTDFSPIGFHGFNWGLLEDSQQLPSSAPKYQSALDFIRRNPCWWANCRH